MTLESNAGESSPETVGGGAASDPGRPDRASGQKDQHQEDLPLDRRARVRIVGAGVVIAGFVATYVYNTYSWRGSLLRADQWYWVEYVLIPYQQGEMSLFEAVTFEYELLSHGHIPTLMTFLFSYEFLDLSPTPDRVIGVISLGLVLLIVFLHSRGFLRLDGALITTAVASSMLFASATPQIFAWSLLQFQLLYMLIGFAYLLSFLKWHDSHPVAHALVAVPAALLLGDAMGAAAIVASFLYLAFLAATRRTKKRALLIYYGLFLLQLLTIGAVFSGQRSHDSSSWSRFVEWAFTEPADLVRGLYYGLASVFGALSSENNALRFLSWDFAPVWFAVTIAVAALAVYLLVRAPLHRRDHFPILVILTGCVWIGGVLRTRVIPEGPEAMQAPRLALYTAVLGVGLLLFLASKTLDQPAIRRPLLVLAAVVVLANGVGSLRLSADNQHWIARQPELRQELRAFVTGEGDEYTDGSRCGRRADCLEPAWFLYDNELGPFRDETAPQRWPTDLRQGVSERLDELTPDQRFALCWWAKVTDEQALADLAINDSPIELESAFHDAGVGDSHEARPAAEQIAAQQIRLACGLPIAPDESLELVD